MYTVGGDFTAYYKAIPETESGKKYTEYYRLFVRKMLNQNFTKVMGRSNFLGETANQLPIINGIWSNLLKNRALLLNCLTERYSDLWNSAEKEVEDSWSKEDKRLNSQLFNGLSTTWSVNSPAYIDYQRRQLLVEIDVLAALRG